jgi:hypothetical protein
MPASALRANAPARARCDEDQRFSEFIIIAPENTASHHHYGSSPRQTKIFLGDAAAGRARGEAWFSEFAIGDLVRARISELRQRYRRSVLGPFWITLSGHSGGHHGVSAGVPVRNSRRALLPFLCIAS